MEDVPTDRGIYKLGLALQDIFSAKKVPYNSYQKRKAVRNFESSNYKKEAMSGHLFLLYNPKSSSKIYIEKKLGSLRDAI